MRGHIFFPRNVMGLLTAFIAFTLYKSWTASSTPVMESSNGPIAGLQLTLAPTGGDADPWSIDATVTNNNDHPVTILNYNSPFDPLSLKLGLFKITPEDATEPIQYPTIAIRRIWPPRRDALVTIQPGQSQSKTFNLKEIPGSDSWEWGQFTVVLKGKWDGVWSVAADEVSQESLEDPVGSPEVQQGDFTSEPLVSKGKNL